MARWQSRLRRSWSGDFLRRIAKGKVTGPLDTNWIHYRQIAVTGTTRQSLRHFQKTLELIATWALEVEDLITSAHPIGEVRAAIANAATGEGLKARITFEDGA